MEMFHLLCGVKTLLNIRIGEQNTPYRSWALEAGWWYWKTLAPLAAQWRAICTVGQMMNRSLQPDKQTDGY